MSLTYEPASEALHIYVKCHALGGIRCCGLSPSVRCVYFRKFAETLDPKPERMSPKP